jgi:plasmid maintenance system antidote protein VapI
MYKIRTDIKTSLEELGKTGADLARALQIDYNILNSYLNGRRHIPYETEKRITMILEGWNV